MACPARDLSDPDLTDLADALNPRRALTAVRPAIRAMLAADAQVVSIRPRLLAYKPRRRCVIAYRVGVRCRAVHSWIAIIGKIRARKNGERALALLRQFRAAGFDATATDGISVPEPIGVVPAFGMWLQRRIDGPTATALLAAEPGRALAERVADAAHKLHLARVPATHRHTVADEIAILDRCFREVATTMPDLAARLARLGTACDRAAAMLPEPAWCGSHRDFYGDQVIVDRTGRLFLIDFDLYCEADPGLDIGNFLGHVSEYAVRCCGDAAALDVVERSMAARFGVLAGAPAEMAARVYAALTVARHVYLSSRIANRRAATLPLLALAEQRLQAVMANGGLA